LSSVEAPALEFRDRAAIRIRERADELHRHGQLSSQIDMAISQSDHLNLRPLLNEIADLLSPKQVELLK